MFSMVVVGQASGQWGPLELCLLVGNVIKTQSSMLCRLVKKRGKIQRSVVFIPGNREQAAP